MLDPDIRERWIEALRSGAFHQTTDELHQATQVHGNAPGYCCLGVLCVIEGFELPTGEISCLAADGEELRHEYRQTIGLSSEAQKELINLNDRAGATFEQIADWIEEYL